MGGRKEGSERGQQEIWEEGEKGQSGRKRKRGVRNGEKEWKERGETRKNANLYLGS